MRSKSVLLALLAVLSVAAQPVCAALRADVAALAVTASAQPNDASHGSGDNDNCCTRIAASVMVTPSSGGSAQALFSGFSPAAPLPRFIERHGDTFVHMAPASSAEPPPVLPYYSRTARILR